MARERKAVSPAGVAAIAIVVAVVIGFGAYELVSGPGSAASSTRSTLPASAGVSSSSSSANETTTNSSAASSNFASSTAVSSTTSSLLSSTESSTKSSSNSIMSTSASSSSSSISSSTVQSSSCATNSTSVNATAASVAPLLGAFSSLKLEYNITSGSTSLNFTDAYTTVYASATTYKVDVQLNGDGISMNSTAWILRNGTALAVDELGNNETGAAGQQLVGNLFAGFTAEIQAGSELSQYTASPGFHSDGNSTVTLGPSTFTVTNYVANSLPLTEAACGATTVITSFNLSVGEPQGSGYELVTFIQFDASVTGSGIPTSAVGYVIQIVSVTVASQAGG